MAELLEDIQGVNTIQNESQSTFLRGSSKMVFPHSLLRFSHITYSFYYLNLIGISPQSHRRRGKEMKLVIKKSTSVSGKGYINSKDRPDLIGSEESSDNEVSLFDLMILICLLIITCQVIFEMPKSGRFKEWHLWTRIDTAIITFLFSTFLICIENDFSLSLFTKTFRSYVTNWFVFASSGEAAFEL